MSDWSEFGVREGMSISARSSVLEIPEVAQFDPFYYRLHSPVVLIEFEHLPGVAFDNPEPSRHHIHTIVRTPNGGDYGADLISEHHARFDHNGRGKPAPN